jgi:hypothetical protein
VQALQLAASGDLQPDEREILRCRRVHPHLSDVLASHVIVYVTPGITPPPLGVVLLDRQSFDAGAVEQALLR